MPDPPQSAHHRFERLDEGVWAAIARPDGTAVCNSGAVDLGDGAAAFDAGMTPEAAVALRSAAGRALGREVSLLVTSHYHLDHTLGNPGFPGVPIWGTRRTRELVLEQVPHLEADLRLAEIDRELARVEELLAGSLREEVRADAAFLQQVYRGARAASARAQLWPPSSTFAGRLALPGARGAELRSFGPGHTADDAVLFLPRERILYAGDLVTAGVQPSLGSSDPERWIGVLGALAALKPERIVPGHGPVSGPEAIEATATYLREILRAAAAPTDAPLPQELRRWDGSLTWGENVAFVRARRAPGAGGTP